MISNFIIFSLCNVSSQRKTKKHILVSLVLLVLGIFVIVIIYVGYLKWTAAWRELRTAECVNSKVINHSIEPQILDISIAAGIAHMKKCKKHKPCSWREIFLWNLRVSYGENCCKNKIIYFNHSHNYLRFIYSFLLLSPITLFCGIWRLCVSQINYDL